MVKNYLKTVRRKTTKSEDTDLCNRKTCRHYYCSKSAEGKWLTAGANQALLHQDMLPWIYATVHILIEIRLTSRTAHW
jgi:hypothetical protein